MNEPATDDQPAAYAPGGSGAYASAGPGGGRPHFPDSPLARTATEPFRLSSATPPVRPPTSSAAPRRRAPMVVTGAVLTGALVVVGAATWVAQRPEPAPVSAASVAPVRLVRSSAGPAPGGTSAPLQTEVGTPEAAGTMVVSQHRWTTVSPTTTSTRLMVHVRLSLRSGALSYDPNLVKVFDDSGRLYENSLPLGSSGELGSGRLSAGDTTDGWVAFDVPAGTTTLVLSSWRGESLAAIRIPR